MYFSSKCHETHRSSKVGSRQINVSRGQGGRWPLSLLTMSGRHAAQIMFLISISYPLKLFHLLYVIWVCSFKGTLYFKNVPSFVFLTGCEFFFFFFWKTVCVDCYLVYFCPKQSLSCTLQWNTIQQLFMLQPSSGLSKWDKRKTSAPTEPNRAFGSVPGFP